MKMEEKAVMEAVDRYLRAYARKDVTGCMVFVCEEGPVLMLGTNDDEVFSDRESLRKAYERDFASMDGIVVGSYRSSYVKTDGQVASVFVEIPFTYQSGGKEVKTLFRMALGLVKEDGSWRMCSGMTSVPFKTGTYSF